MKTVYKYTLDLVDLQVIQLPYDSTILSVAEQFDQIVLYALVDPAETLVAEHTIRIAGTGHTIKQPHVHFIGSIVLEAGHLVFHVFEVFE